MERLRYAAMHSKPHALAVCVCSALACSGCSDRRVVTWYEGIDPSGKAVDVALYISPFDANTPVCLAPAEPDKAEVKLIAQSPGKTGRETFYLARRHYSQCGAEIFAAVMYWQTTAQGPQVCLYRTKTAEDAQLGQEVAGAWDYCTRLQPYRR